MNQQRDSYTILYKNHGVTVGFWEGWVESTGKVIIQYAKSLNGKPVRKEYQANAKNVGRSNATTPYEQGVLELQSKARLKQDKGYVTALSEAQAPATNGLGLDLPMLATPLEKVKPNKIEWEGAFVQPKLDGHRALFKDGVLYSRQGKVLELPHIVEAIHDAALSTFHLDGELYLHGKSLQELSKLIKKHRPETLDLQYHVYDVVSDLPFYGRITTLASVFPKAHSILRPVETREIGTEDELMEHHARYRNQGYEGTMLRFGDDPYRTGKRSRTLLKVKEFQDEEFIIVDVKEGKPYVTSEGTYQVPVWVCSAGEGRTFTVTAQGNMQEKHQLWETRHQHIGRPLTVKFHYFSKDGIPQLPVALRFFETV